MKFVLNGISSPLYFLAKRSKNNERATVVGISVVLNQIKI